MRIREILMSKISRRDVENQERKEEVRELIEKSNQALANLGQGKEVSPAEKQAPPP